MRPGPVQPELVDGDQTSIGWPTKASPNQASRKLESEFTTT